MVIGVLGGTGTAGREVTAELRRRGHEVIVLSRRAPTEGEHRAVDVATGAGLEAAMAGLDAVVDAVGGSAEVLVDGVGRALRAGRAAGVGHWVSLSVVGAGAVPFGYHRAMGRREVVVRAGEVPWSILRATQFHSLVDMVLAAAARRGVLPLLRVPVQPVDAREVGVALADGVEAGPSCAVAELVGPRTERLDDLALAWASAHDVRRLRIRIPVVGHALRAVRGGALTSPGAPHGAVSFGDWLRADGRSAPAASRGAARREAAGWT
jgi:uncharacterized protein YbjT (DUF2867 family)